MDKQSLKTILTVYFEDLRHAGVDDYLRPQTDFNDGLNLMATGEVLIENNDVVSETAAQHQYLSMNSLNNNDPITPGTESTFSSEFSKKSMISSKQTIENILDSSDRLEQLKQLAIKVSHCQKCPVLVENRTQTVFGSGNPYSELVFIGEGPGADEDKQGLPFVGRSGQLLTDIITKGMKLKREDVYICNIVRCRPPGNRNPTSVEADCCRPFLDATLEIIRPKYICCLGSIAAVNLLHSDQKIGQLRGIVHDYHDAKVVCTYHPAYLLRNPPAKAQTWEDIKLLMKIMNLSVS